jgi:hypothetical protein
MTVDAVLREPTFDLADKRMCAELARDVLAFANTGGGHLIFGVHPETYEPVGIGDRVEVDTTKLHDALHRYIGSGVGDGGRLQAAGRWSGAALRDRLHRPRRHHRDADQHRQRARSWRHGTSGTATTYFGGK